MSLPRLCGECGALLPSSAPEDVCPSCAFRAAIAARNPSATSFDPAALLAPAEEDDHPPLGDYDQFKLLARGGMGVVYRARQISLNRRVAVKLILGGRLASAAEVQRFRKESTTAAKLQHPNIVAIHEVGEENGQHFFSMDFVEGEDLGRVAERGALTPRRAAEFVKICAEAIHFAHEHGVLHRDLKPSNILLDSIGVPRITDFGLARLDGTPGLTLSGEVLGTPGFISPEQAEGRHGQVDCRTDIYSLGAILFHLVTGQPPFQAETPQKTIAAALTQEPGSPRRINPLVPRDLETICLKCLERDPTRRYLTALELSEELGRFLRDEAIRARPISRAERVWRWSRRNPVTALFSAAFVLALIGSIITLAVSRARIAASRDLQRTQLARLKVTEGWRLVEDGDLFAALTPFTDALLLEKDDPKRQEMHRYRIASVLQDCPQLLNMWFPGGPIKHLELSPDGSKVLTAIGLSPGRTNGAAQLWDLKTGNPVGEPMTHAGTVNWATFSPDGALVVTASDDNTARVWDGRTGLAVSPPVMHPDHVLHASFSANSELVVSCSASWPRVTNGYACVWSPRDGRVKCDLEVYGMDAQRVWFEPNGTAFWVGCRTFLCNEWEIATTNVVGKIASWATFDGGYSADNKRFFIAGHLATCGSPELRFSIREPETAFHHCFLTRLAHRWAS